MNVINTNVTSHEDCTVLAHIRLAKMLRDNCSDERGRTLNISFLALHTMLLHKLGQSVR